MNFFLLSFHVGVFVILGIGLTSTALKSKYPFSEVLFEQGDQYYGLHWNFTKESETIYFAVNVSTNGWVGFGLSPNGLMPGSDLIMGWVDGDSSFFHDRFALRHELPPIDMKSQNWFQTSSKEENGFTILEFYRKFTTCDTQDMDIMVSSALVIWSYSLADPRHPFGTDAVVHNYKGSSKLNLIGRVPTVDTAPSEGIPFIDVITENVTIPSSDTTYWCVMHKLPAELISTKFYIKKVVPIITPHSSSFVHHIIVYLCHDVFSERDVGLSRKCDDLTESTKQCLFEVVLGGWAVGGEGIVYPDGVAFPMGGAGYEVSVLLEIHYDNAKNVEDVVDSSGLRFYYTNMEPKNMAGSLLLGRFVEPIMYIPPRANNFTIASICPSSCTNSFIPPEGIRIFGNFLHTHIAGRQVLVEHYRVNPAGKVVELERIDQNLNYDFNRQQYTHLAKEHIVLPGDILMVKCVYETKSRSQVTKGGLSTLDEMCLSFILFYPRPTDMSAMANCLSYPSENTYTEFLSYANITYRDFSTEPIRVLNSLDWEGNSNLARKLQDSVISGVSLGGCGSEAGVRRNFLEPGLKVDIFYEAPEVCVANVTNPRSSS